MWSLLTHGAKKPYLVGFLKNKSIVLSMIIQLTKNWNGENEENDEVEKEEMEVKRWKKRTNFKPIVKNIYI